MGGRKRGWRGGGGEGREQRRRLDFTFTFLPPHTSSSISAMTSYALFCLSSSSDHDLMESNISSPVSKGCSRAASRMDKTDSWVQILNPSSRASCSLTFWYSSSCSHLLEINAWNCESTIHIKHNTPEASYRNPMVVLLWVKESYSPAPYCSFHVGHGSREALRSL
jgi:hypothetical protein